MRQSMAFLSFSLNRGVTKEIPTNELSLKSKISCPSSRGSYMETERTKQVLEKQHIVSLLRSFARQIQSLEEDEIGRLLAGDWRIEVGLGKSMRRNRTRARCSPIELERLRHELSSTVSRESAKELIENVVRSREDLTDLAKALDIPAPKRSSTENLKDRLIEATVGFRLRSAAIRGNDYSPDKQASSSTRRP